MSDFRKGTTIKLLNGDSVSIVSKIGEGGQGAVYRVKYNGREYALKWYLDGYLKNLKPSYKNFYKNLAHNVEIGSPSSAFLWQKAIAITGQQSNGFGYLMDLRPQQYEEFTKFIKAKVHFSNTKAVIRAAVNVVEAFQDLHRKGLSYQDLSPGNFFINPQNGDVLICDNDNVAPDGMNLGIGGTPGYMAPEVILGTDKPGTNTDLFSLSVILFELLFLSHPLDGANCCKYPCLTQKVERELYAEKPVFVMSPTDHSNAPVRNVHSNLINLWGVFPDYLHEAFTQAFEQGTKDPKWRLSENDWKKVLYRLLDTSEECPKCHEINFVETGKNQIIQCSVCRKQYALPYMITIGSQTVLASPQHQLLKYHTNHGSREEIVGTFVESKKTPGVYGLKNESPLGWEVTYPGKEVMVYETGKVVTVIPGTTIKFGNVTMEIKESK